MTTFPKQIVFCVCVHMCCVCIWPPPAGGVWASGQSRSSSFWASLLCCCSNGRWRSSCCLHKWHILILYTHTCTHTHRSVCRERQRLSGLVQLCCCVCVCAGVTGTCGGAAVLGILGEGHSSLHSVFLHLLDGVLRQRMNVPEADVELVRSWGDKVAIIHSRCRNTVLVLFCLETASVEI